MSLSIAEAILEATRALQSAGISEPRRQASSLLANVLKVDQTFLITRAETKLTPRELDSFRQGVGRRARGEPLQYIKGFQEFFGLDFEVNQNALIPRPETELLVETALGLVADASASPFICEIGAGTGCISISLLHKRPRARAVAVDISPSAARLASRNAARNEIGKGMSIMVADCFAAFHVRPVFDLIVSNPPYIADRDWEGLQREVREYEPRLALTSGSDGLAMIRRLILEAPAFLLKGGHLLLEIGYDQGVAVEQMIDPRVWKLVAIHNDLRGIPRTVVLRKQ
ncbi:MAG: protein-(glutamine-N5) methyltransferase, release factor-specific [Acidobacteria bacterium]|nr:protein-(glutamine-N5) methyltransferase, release factor-specific [Acidobacteriota bacterium]